MSNQKFDREIKDHYQLTIVASEYCDCDLIDSNKTNSIECNFLNKKYENIIDYEKNINSSDIYEMRVNIYVRDVDDNQPRFLKNIYQIGITSDIDFDETILNSYVSF